MFVLSLLLIHYFDASPIVCGLLCVWSMFCYALRGVLFSCANSSLIKRESESWLIKCQCLLAVFCLLVFFVSSIRCRRLACSVFPGIS